MRIGAFEIDERLPELREPHAFARLRPWVDVGSVGSLVLARLESQYEMHQIGRLARPGTFFDFTRYRPTVYWHEGERRFVIPNSPITCVKRPRGNDFVLLHLLEPHMAGEDYVDAIFLLLRKLGIKRYCLIGSMYDMVPHTRPLLVTGGSASKSAESSLRKAGIQTSGYQGPTTIVSLLNQHCQEAGIDTMSLIAHLPQYTELEEDYTGVVRLMGILNSVYDVPVEEIDIRKAEEQQRQLDQVVAQDPRLKGIVTQLESHYDTQAAKKEQEESRLSPEIEQFLKEMDNRFQQD